MTWWRWTAIAALAAAAACTGKKGTGVEPADQVPASSRPAPTAPGPGELAPTPVAPERPAAASGPVDAGADCVADCVRRNQMRAVGVEVIEEDCRQECATGTP